MVDFRALTIVAACGFALASIYLVRAPALRASARAHAEARTARPPAPP